MQSESAALRARLGSHRRLVDIAVEMTAAHLAAHGGYVAWSGGKDSTVCAWLAHTVAPGTPIVTYVAGTEYPEVLPYCAEVAEAQGWDWHPIQTADVPALLDDGVRPSSEGPWWDAMIGGPHQVARDAYGDGLIWGMRGTESAMRAAMLYSIRGVRTRLDGVTTCAPLWRWHTDDVWAALARAEIPPCPVYDRMAEIGMPPDARRVGRIVGRRGMEERMAWLHRGWPELWATYRARWPDL